MTGEGISLVNGIAAGWAGAIVRASGQGAAAILLVWVACRALPQLSSGAQCWLWRLAFLKLFVALLWASPIDLPLLRAAPPADLPSDLPAPPRGREVAAPAGMTPALEPPDAPLPFLRVASPPETRAPVFPRRSSASSTAASAPSS